MPHHFIGSKSLEEDGSSHALRTSKKDGFWRLVGRSGRSPQSSVLDKCQVSNLELYGKSKPFALEPGGALSRHDTTRRMQPVSTYVA